MGTIKRSGQIAMGLAVIACGAWAVDASAATITQKQDNSSSESWNTAATWNPSGTPTAGNDYVNPGFIPRSPVTNNSTFAGDSLTFTSSSSALGLKVPDNTTGTQTINNLTLVAGSGNGPSITNYANGSTITLGGSITISGSSGNVRLWSGKSDRVLKIGASITGSAGPAIVIYGGSSGADDGLVEITSSNNAYAGGWNIQANLKGSGNGSLGSGDFTVHEDGSLDFDYDATANSLTLVSDGGSGASHNGALLVNQSGLDLTFNAATIDGNALAAGTYTFSNLATTYGSDLIKISNGGAGTLTVVPEPASVAVLVGLGALGMLKRKRRAANA